MSKRFLDFGQFRIDTQNHVLLRLGTGVPLKPKVFDTLLVLARNQGRVIDKGELMNRLWPDTVVEESNLTQNIYILRRILGETQDGMAHIETLPRRGYRFVPPVSEVDDETAAPVASRARAHTSRRAVIVVLNAALVAGLIAYIWRADQHLGAPTMKSLAVLPFRPLGSDPADEILGFGMADTLITRLSAIKGTVVRPTSAIRKFSGPAQDPATAGRDLKVDGVLEGTLQHAGTSVRVTLRLIRVADATTIWAGTVDAPSGNVLALEDRLADEVSRALAPIVSADAQRRPAKPQTNDSEAERLYVMGRYHWNKVNALDWLTAIEYFKRAIEKDPHYARAYAGLADCYLSIVADSQVPKAEAVASARQAASRALELDSDLAEAHVSLGRITAYYDWDWSRAGNEFARAIDLDAHSANAHGEYAYYLAAIGQGDGAVAEALQASELDPLSQIAHFQVVWALVGAHRYEDAIAHAEPILRTFSIAHYWIGMADLGLGESAEAASHFESVVAGSPDELLTKAHLGYAYGVLGRQRESKDILAGLEAEVEQRRGSPYLVAIVYAGLSDRDSAFAWLDRARVQRSRLLAGLKVNPVWKDLRNDVRFTDLLRQVGLPQ